MRRRRVFRDGFQKSIDRKKSTDYYARDDDTPRNDNFSELV